MAFAPRKRNPANTAPARGKITASRTTRPTNRIQQSSEGKAPKTPIHASTALKTSQSAGKPVKPSVSTRRTPHETTTSGPKAVVKTSTRSVSATSSNDPSLSNQPARIVDPLQIAAQLYPWLYMTSNLETSLQTARSAYNSAFDQHARKLSEEEATIGDQRVRFDAERRVAFFEELVRNTISGEVPEIMQSFLRNGETCEKVITEALRVSTQDCSRIDYSAPIQLHNSILDKLEIARTEAIQLETLISGLMDGKNILADSPLTSIFGACLPVVRVRSANLAIARDLIESSKANLGMHLQIESLRLIT